MLSVRSLLRLTLVFRSLQIPKTTPEKQEGSFFDAIGGRTNEIEGDLSGVGGHGHEGGGLTDLGREGKATNLVRSSPLYMRRLLMSLRIGEVVELKASSCNGLVAMSRIIHGVGLRWTFAFGELEL